MERTLLIYETLIGKQPFSDWLSVLKDVKGRATVRARLERIRLGNFGDCKSLGDGVSELKISYGPGYRVYFGQQGDQIVVLLCGGDKGSQRKDITRAKLLWKEYKDANKKLSR